MTGQLAFWDAQEKALLDVLADQGEAESAAPPKRNSKPPRFYQVECLEAIRCGFEGGEEREPLRSQLVVLPTGMGKCLGRDTPVLMFDGTVKPVQDIRNGDLLMGPDSKPRRVASTTVGHGPLRRIVPVKGDPWVCNDAHVLTLKHSVSGRVVDVPMPQYEAASRTFRHEHKQFSVGVDFEQAPGQKPIDPYCLGVWLGDGTKCLRSFQVSKPDQEIGDALRAVANAYPGHVVTRRVYGDKCPTWTVTATERSGRGGSPLLFDMRALFGNDVPRIPRQYLTASRAERLELLAGLMDTDGHLTEGCYDFVQKAKAIADDTAFLARSLGLKVTSREKIVNGCVYHRLTISGETSIVPCRIQRKRAAQRLQKKDALRTGFSVEHVGDGDYFGFMLDGDGRFLLGDFTVTHNTFIFSELARTWSGTVLVVAHRDELILQAKAELERATGERVGIEKAAENCADERVVVTSVQTMSRRCVDFRPDRFSLVIIDEAHRAAAASYRKVMDYFATAKILGVTATPDRADERALGTVFDDVAYKMDILDGIDIGYLVPVEGEEVVVQEIDLSGVERLTDDDALDEAMLKAVEGVVQKAHELCGSEQAIIFTPGVRSAHAMAERMNLLAPGKAIAIDGETERELRRRLVGGFKAGLYQYLFNCDVATEGFDAPNTSIVGMAAPTNSRARYAQRAGRGTRVLPGVVDHLHGPENSDARRAAIAASAKPRMRILDFVGNAGKHTLCTPMDVLGESYSDEEVAEAKRRAKQKTGESTDLYQALKDARAALKRQADALKAAQLKVNARVQRFDPFKACGMDRDDAISIRFGSRPVTPNQAEILLNKGIAEADVRAMDFRSASRMLNQLQKRRKAGLATLKQLAAISKWFPVPPDTTFQAASKAMDYIGRECEFGKRQRISGERVAHLLGGGA